MRFHGVDLFHTIVEIDGLGVLVASRASLLVFEWVLPAVLFGLVLKHSTLFGRVPRAMQYACLFRTGRRIACMDCIFFLVFVSASLFGVGWRGGSSSLLLQFKTGIVGF